MTSFVEVEQDTLRVAVSSQEKLMRVADRYRRKMMRLLVEPVAVSRAMLDEQTLEMLLSLRMLEPVLVYIDKAIVGLEAPFRLAEKNKISTLVLDIQEAAGNATRCDYTAECLIEFDVTNPEAVVFAEAHAAELVTAVSAETKLSIRNVVVRMFNEGIPPKQGASLIKQVVGLTEVQANAVLNLQQKVLANPGKLIYAGKTAVRVPQTGMSAEQLKKVTGKYADRLTRQRAMNIARTETVKAANEGQVSLWRQAQKRGDLPKDLKHEWIASFTERTCPICQGANGEVVPVGATFSTGTTIPPAHPSCRCSTGLVLK